MGKQVLVLDYGVGNLMSVCRAFEHCGAKVLLSADPQEVLRASRVVLPGVGAFGDCVAALRDRSLDEVVKEYVSLERPLLGICVGMQMLFDGSEEFGLHQGLGIIPGMVKSIPAIDSDGMALKIPHIGWSVLKLPENRKPDWWDGSILKDLPTGIAGYFVHSYSGHPLDATHLLAEICYGGHRIAAAVRKEVVFGTQFHPEKSGPAGLSIIQSYLEI